MTPFGRKHFTNPSPEAALTAALAAVEHGVVVQAVNRYVSEDGEPKKGWTQDAARARTPEEVEWMFGTEGTHRGWWAAADVAASDLFVIDADTHDGSDGVALLEEIAAAEEIDLDAFIQTRTPSDGLHVVTSLNGLEPRGNAIEAWKSPSIDLLVSGFVPLPGQDREDGPYSPVVSFDEIHEIRHTPTVFTDRYAETRKKTAAALGPSTLPPPEPLPDPLPPEIAEIIDEPVEKGMDKSGRATHLLRLCAEHGFTLGQVNTAAARHEPTRVKYGSRRDRDLRLLEIVAEKIASRERHAAAQDAWTPQNPPAPKKARPSRRVDLGAILDEANLAAEEPKYLIREDDKPLLYPGRTHAFVGQPESGKTWLALVAIAQRVRRSKYGTVATFIDFEDTPKGFLRRLVALGVEPSEIARTVAYYRPDGPLDADLLEEMRPDLERSEIIVIDSTNEAIVAQGGDPLSNRDVVHFRQTAINPIVEATKFGAVVLIDHEGKSKDGQALGGVMKRAGIQGAEFLVRTKEQPRPGERGRINVYVTKDREGAVRSIAQTPKDGEQRQHVASLVLDPRDGTDVGLGETLLGSIKPTVYPPRGTEAEHPFDYALADVIVVAVRDAAQPLSKKVVADHVRAKNVKRGDAPIRAEIIKLVDDGWITVTTVKGTNFDSFEAGPKAADGLPSDLLKKAPKSSADLAPTYDTKTTAADHPPTKGEDSP